jgi:parallel beta-helix repeat protein
MNGIELKKCYEKNRCEVENCVFSENDVGIFLCDSNVHVVISDSRFIKQKEFGIELMPYSRSTIKNNKFEKNNSGICASQSTELSLIGNTFEKNDKKGVEVRYDVNIADFKGNVISQNGEIGTFLIISNLFIYLVY